MALTPFRWLAIAVIGCVMILVASLRQPREETAAEREQRRLQTNVSFYRQRAARVASRLQTAQLIAAARPAAAGAPQAIRAVYDSALPPDLRAASRLLVERATRTVGSSGTGIDLAFVYDTAQSVRGSRLSLAGVFPSYVLPRLAGDRCSVIVRVRPAGPDPKFRRTLLPVLYSPASIDQLLGPCAYYREFGMPGPQIGAWLGERGWRLASDGSWSRPARPVYFDMRQSRYRELLSPALFAMNISGARCVAGQTDQCERIILETGRNPSPVWNGNVLPAANRIGASRYAQGADLGQREAYMLADMVRGLGRERFAKFWTSPDAVPAAFQQAAGEPLGHWVAGWTKQHYGEVVSGPSTTVYTMAVSLLLVILSLFVALRVSARRQFA